MNHWTLSTCTWLYYEPLDVVHLYLAVLCTTGRLSTSIWLYCAPLDVVHLYLAVLCTTGRCPPLYGCTVYHWTLSRVCCCTMNHWTLSTCTWLYYDPLDVVHLYLAVLCTTGPLSTSIWLYCAPLDVVHLYLAVLCTTGRCPPLYGCTVYHWTLSRVCCCTMNHWTLSTSIWLYCAPTGRCPPLYGCTVHHWTLSHLYMAVLCTTGRCHVSVAVL